MNLPYSKLAERDVIGQALVFPSAAEVVANELEPEDFFVPLCAAAASVVRQLVRSGQRVTIEAVGLELERLDGRSDYDALREMALSDNGLSPRKAVEEVWECAARRRVALAADDVKTGALDRMKPFEDVTDAAKLLAGLAEVPVASSLASPDALEFIQGDDSYDWTLPGLLEKGDRLMLTAEEGHGKSTFLRQLAVCSAVGLSMFNGQRIIPKSVLILDCENGRAQVRRALRLLVHVATKAGLPLEPGTLRVCCRPDGLDLANRADVRFLHERMQADHPDIVVMGPLYKMVAASPIDEEPAAKVARVLDSVRERYSATLVIEAHAPHAVGGANREMRPYGASLWKRWPEFGLGIVAAKDPNYAELRNWRGPREERAWPTKLRRGGAWPWTAA